MLTAASTRTALALLGLAAALSTRAQTNEVRRPLELPDPTPRPEDLQQRYSDKASGGQEKQKAAALRRAQNGEQIRKATDLLLLLAQRLNDDAAAPAKRAPAPVSVQRAYEIETLAKIVRERMKLQ